MVTCYEFRPAVRGDLPAIMSIMEQAKAQMASEGRRQWDETYPAVEHISADIDFGYGYVVAIDGVVATYGAIVFDGEPAYNEIEGRWLSAEPYVVLHRLAVADKWKSLGLAVRFMREVERRSIAVGVNSFKVDTNYDNLPMKRVLDKLGFIYCGKIHYQKGERLAYEKILTRNGL